MNWSTILCKLFDDRIRTLWKHYRNNSNNFIILIIIIININVIQIWMEESREESIWENKSKQKAIRGETLSDQVNTICIIHHMMQQAEEVKAVGKRSAWTCVQTAMQPQ